MTFNIVYFIQSMLFALFGVMVGYLLAKTEEVVRRGRLR